MPRKATDQQLVDDFRRWFETAIGEHVSFEGVSHHDREDGSTLAARWPAGEDLWFELTIRPLLPQVRVGVLTSDRWKSEELEQRIEDSGDTMSEYVEAGFDEVGLEWSDPPVEHYRDQGKYFYFATPLDLVSLAELKDEAVRDKIVQMFRAYVWAFGPPSE